MWWRRSQKRSAEEIVHAFAKFLEHTDSLICDDRVLPMRRDDLINAFQEYLAFLELRESLFREPKIKQKRLKVMALMPYAFEFQRIETEDLVDVQQMNNSAAFEFCRQCPDAVKHIMETDPGKKDKYIRYSRVFLKYHIRATSEYEAWITKM
jgi:hypothetical protein